MTEEAPLDQPLRRRLLIVPDVYKATWPMHSALSMQSKGTHSSDTTALQMQCQWVYLECCMHPSSSRKQLPISTEAVPFTKAHITPVEQCNTAICVAGLLVVPCTYCGMEWYHHNLTLYAAGTHIVWPRPDQTQK